MASHSDYAFKTMRERALTLGSAAAGLAVFGLGLSAVFNPVAIGVVGAYAAYGVAGSLLLSVPAVRNWEFGRMVKQGHAEQVSEDTDIYRLTKEISDSLGRPTPPKIYTVDVDTAAKMALPLGLRWLRKIPKIRETLEDKMMPKLFAAIPGANTIITTQEALERGTPEAQMRFIAAHEMSHLKTDNLSPALYAKAIFAKMSQPLMLGLGVAGALALFGVGLPVAASVGFFGALKAGVVLAGLNFVAGAAINYGLRLVETRADRNGLYLTRDLKAAEDTMDWLHDRNDKKPVSPLKEARLDHPSYWKRMSSLRESFNTVAKYPPLAPVNDNGAPQPKAAVVPKAA